MLKIINGRKYSTETAKWISENQNGYGSGDIHYVKESLYLKKTGEYFLYGEGGPYTIYGKRYGNDSCFGEEIVPLTLEEAKQWVSENCDGEDYIRLFGDVDE